MYEDRIERAVENFKKGYNCTQSVVEAFADLYGIDTDVALRMAASFGGGIGRMRLTCGTASGMFLLAGLETGVTDPTDRAGKGANYAVVQQLAAEFKESLGSIVCADLLGLNRNAPTPPTPEARTAEYYRKRPCPEIVRTAATIYAHFLESRRKDQQ